MEFITETVWGLLKSNSGVFLEKSKIAIVNGKLFIKNSFKKGTVLIEDGIIKNVFLKKINIDELKDYKIINASECYVSYGFIDPHVHFRCPGNELKEDWESGGKAALQGGFTFVIDMPNNIPPAVDVKTIIQKNEIAKKSKINYGFHIGLTDQNSNYIENIYSELKLQNIPVFGIKVFLGSSTGNLLIKNPLSLKKSLETSIINLFHCEDEDILQNYKNIPYSSVVDHNLIRPPEAEVSALKKIIESCKLSKNKANIYICHISSEKLLKTIKKYKNKGFNIISEVTPHHLSLCIEELEKTNIAKVNPPIRTKKDVKTLRKYFNKGFFDIIGTDHAPHLLNEKNSPTPPSGFPGLESAFYALYNLYERKLIPLKMIFKLLTNGYKIFDIKNRGEIKKGCFADLTIIKKEAHTFKVENTATKAKYSPFDGLKTNCKIYKVLINGELLYENKK